VGLHKICTTYTSLDDFREKMGQNRWFHNLDELLAITTMFARRIREQYDSILIQSRDGDDICAQISSLIQLLIDPYYRTIQGFGVLVEKEWIYMGHKFCDYTKTSKVEDQYIHAATWIHFLDAVSQLLRAYPEFFEFNEEFLIFLVDHTFSCRFGNFLYSCEKARRSGKIVVNTASIWGYVLENKKEFLNSFYQSSNPNLDHFPLDRSVGVGLWASVYLRHTFVNPLSSQNIEFERRKAKMLMNDPTELKDFSVSNCGIVVLPPLPEFVSLVNVRLAGNFLTSLPVAIFGSCPNLHTLDLSNNLIASISEREMAPMAKLSLRVLFLQGNGLRFVPDSLEPLRGIECLKLSNNKVNFLPDLSVLADSLTHLDLSENELVELVGFGSLIKLREARLTNNLLVDLGDVERMTNLVVFETTGNSLTKVPDGVSQLCRLEHFDISDNPLVEVREIFLKKTLTTLRMNNAGLRTLPSNIPSELAGRLTVISLQGNKLLTFPNALLACRSLMVLLVNNNLLESIPFEICRLVNLKRLAISGNKLVTLTSGIAKLPRLEVLEMHNNKIEELPVSFGSLNLHRWTLEGNPIRNIPEELLMKKDFRVILDFLNSVSKGSSRLYRMKFMIVGQENVGKTSLLNCLLRTGDKSTKNKKAVNKTISTDGIDIHTYNFNCPVNENGKPAADGKNTQIVSLTAWDFGGQEIYYTTHQFFLSHRSVYVVVWNLSLDEEYSRVEYWLQSILARAKGCKILLVGTHLDEVTPEKASRIVKQMSEKYLQKIPGLMSPILTVSCQTGEGIDKFINLLQNVTLNERTMGEMLPHVYLRLETQVKGEALSKKNRLLAPVMEWDDFKALAQTCEINDEKQLNLAIELLHNLGTLIHFRNDEQLSQIVILDPSWLTKLMATLMTTKHHFIKDGKISHHSFRQIWRAPDFPESLHPVVYRILEKFEVLLSLKEFEREEEEQEEKEKELEEEGFVNPEFYDGESLVPSLLPDTSPEDTNSIWDTVARNAKMRYGRIYLFPFLPHGLYQRLAIRVYGLSKKIVIWQKGIFLRLDDDIGLIKIILHPPAPKKPYSSVEISAIDTISSSSSITQKLFQMAIETLDSLMDGWYELNPQVDIPCSKCLLQNGHSSHFFGLEECEYAVIDGERFIPCPIPSENGGKEEMSNGIPTNQLVPLEIMVPDILMVGATERQLKESDLDIGPKIGEGGFADVFRGVYRENIVAIKKLKFKDESTSGGATALEAFSEFRREVWIMAGLNHFCLCGLVGFCIFPPLIVCEFVNFGDLYTFLHREKDDPKYQEITVALRMRMALDMAQGMRYLHTRDPPIIHRDLKSPNVLLSAVTSDASVVCKIADFGLSQVLLAPTAGRKVANPVWLAPEVMLKQPYGEKSDVYSFGVILWELLSRKDFFGEQSFLSKIEEMVLEGKRDKIPDCDPAFARLIEAAWGHKPSKRPSFQGIVMAIRSLIDRSDDCESIRPFTSPDSVDGELIARRKKLSLTSAGGMAKPSIRAQRQRNRMFKSFKSQLFHKTNSSNDVSQDYLACFSQSFQNLPNIMEQQQPTITTTSPSSSSSPLSTSPPSSSSSSSLSPRSVFTGPSRSISPTISVKMKNQPKPVSPTAAIRQSQDHVRLRASTEFNPFLRGTPKGGSEINKTNAVRKRLLGRSRVEKEEEEDQELDTDYSTPDADDDFPSPSLSPLSTASTPNLTPRSTRTASRNKFIDEFGILDPIPENTLDEYTKNALQEDLVGPAGSNLTPLASIEAEMLQGEIRTLCIITEPGSEMVWLGCDTGKILRCQDKTGQIYDVLSGHSDEILSIAELPGNVWSSDMTGAIRLWHPATGKMKKNINTDKAKCESPITCFGLVGTANVWAGAGDTILLFDLKGNWNRRKRLVLERGSVLTIFYHNGSVWLGTSQGIARANAEDMTVTSYFPQKVGGVPSLIAVGAEVWSSCSDGFIRIWDGETGQCLRFIGDGSNTPFALLLIGGCVWCVLLNGVIQIWDAKSFIMLGSVGTAMVSEKHLPCGGMVMSPGCVVWASRGPKAVLWGAEAVMSSLGV